MTRPSVMAGRRLGLLALLVVMSAGCDSPGEPPVERPGDEVRDHRIFLARRTFVPAPDVSQFLASGRRHGLLQLDQTPRDLGLIRALGIQIYGAQRNHSYFVTIPPGLTAKELRRIGARALFALEPRDKISRRLPRSGGAQSDFEDSVRVVVHFVPTTAQAVLSAALHRARATLVSLGPPPGRAKLELPRYALLRLAREPWLMWIDTAIEPGAPDLDVVAERIGADEIRPPPWGTAAVGTGLTGDGVNVGIWEAPLLGDETAVLESHPDLVGRVTFGPDQSVVPSFHATNVAGVIAGDGSASQAEGGDPFQWAGIAPEAQIISWDSTDAATEMVTSLGSFDTTITNHSFGVVILSEILCSAAGSYDSTAMDFDDVVRGSGITAFVSPGNNAELLSNLGCTVDVWGDGALVPLSPEVVEAGFGSITALGVAKNPVAVGGRRKSSPGGIASYSGRGPTTDGRLKPDVVAISGDEETLITMPSTPQTYQADLGVSYAVPQGTGAAALLLEHYRLGDPTFVQDPAVFKAVLANTASDVGASGPDYTNGFGLIQVQEALEAADSYTTITIGQGDEELMSLNADMTDTCGLRVMAAWSDPPPMGFSALQLVNDVDLSVFSGDGEVLPWVLTPGNPLNGATHGINVLDNVEQVTIDAPTGNEIVRVIGSDVPLGPQPVVIHWYPVPCDAGMDATDGAGASDDDGNGAGCGCATGPQRRGNGSYLWAMLLAARRSRSRRSTV